MAGRWDEIPVSIGSMGVYVSAPNGAVNRPGIVVVQHAGGVDEFVRGQTDKLADAGFVGIAPDLYHREEPDSKDDPMTRMSRLRDITIIEDVNAAVGHARSLPEVDAERLGITGFCMGGRVTYLMSAANPAAFRAAVVCWGGSIMTPWGAGPAPFDMTDQITAPVLGLFGEEDHNPNPADVAKLDAELSRLGKPHEFHSYAGAGHAFMNEGRASYRQEAAKDAWGRSVSWFKRFLEV